MSDEQIQAPEHQAASRQDTRRILLEIELLVHDSYQFQAIRHWDAGRRTNNWWKTANVVMVIINTFIASSVLSLLKNVWSQDAQDWLIAILSLIAALLAALLLKFKPDENLLQLKLQGTKFAQIARRARLIEGRLHDGKLSLDQAWAELQDLTEQYSKLCEEALIANVGSDVTRAVFIQTEGARKEILEKIQHCQEMQNER